MAHRQAKPLPAPTRATTIQLHLATHLLLFSKNTRPLNFPLHPSTVADPTLHEQKVTTERKRAKLALWYYHTFVCSRNTRLLSAVHCQRRSGERLDQVADQTAEGEHEAWGTGEGWRGAVDGNGGLGRCGVGDSRGVDVWVGDTGGDDDGGVVGDCRRGDGTGEC